MNSIISAVLDWVYPPACISCRGLMPLNLPARFICVPCQNLLEPIAAPFCLTCGAPAQNETKQCASCFKKKFCFSHNRSAFIYGELMREMLHEMKFRNKKRVASGLGLFWAMQMDSHAYIIEETENTYLVPMPMHPKKQRERGFNQAEILTRPVAEVLKIPVSNALIRTADTPPQSELHPSRRAENVKDIFAVHKNENVKGKNYILTDDIFTTGASLNECAKTLINAGAARVSCMTLAISVKNNHNP